MLKISLVTVNYNSSVYTKGLLESLLPFSDFIDKVIVVDNASSKEEVDFLNDIVKEFLDRIDVVTILSEVNTGYFGGLNIGLDALDKTGLDGVIVCNNDLVFNGDFFVTLNSKLIEDDVHVICPSVITVDGVYQNPSMSDRPSRLRTLFYDIYYSNYYIGLCLLKVWRYLGLGSDSRFIKDLVERDIFIGIGAIYYLTSSYFSCNENLPNDTFLYGEEAFLAIQIKNSGGRQVYMPDIEVTHFESISTNKLPGFDKYFLNKKAYKKYRDFYRSDLGF
ncbi:glycosyltransferase [Pseudomonas chengduensis]|nr:glycosyltransferase [Pseudomonas chengduensis]MDH1213494.1 glycosyltransferase [Pseudomonas chengduensis]